MKFKSKIAAFILAGVGLFSLPQKSEAGESNYQNGGTNTVLALTTNTYPVMPCAFSKDFGLSVAFNFTVANTSTNFFYLDSSIDLVHWSTNVASFQLIANGTTPVSLTTNIVTGGVPFYRLNIGNTNTVVGMTNIYINTFTKTGL